MKPVPTPPHFDLHVGPRGYAWWYVDGVSDDGDYGLTLILFIGSVFSPRYARARDHGQADPEQHCAVNVALYPRGRRRVWAMAEHAHFGRDHDMLQVGASTIRWRGDTLELDIDERRTHFFGIHGAPLRGRVRLHPTASFARRVELDGWRDEARHRWYPVAPHARIEVEFDEPQLRFSGSGYHDINTGDEGLERAFASWDWSRCELGEDTVITYDVIDRSGRVHPLAWRLSPKRGAVEELAVDSLGPPVALPRTPWGIRRALRCDRGYRPSLERTLEDSPFYARSLIDTQIAGQRGTAVHETVMLDRFAAPWVRMLLPFKITRTKDA